MMIKTCYCRCGWPVHTETPVTIECPQCGKDISCLKYLLIGDWLENFLNLFGGGIYKRWYKKLFKKECDCKKRKRFLNRCGDYLQQEIIRTYNEARNFFQPNKT